MEWVEVRGETLDEAKEEALDQLGVARDDAEFEIVQEAESRWMGLKKTEARVRARVRPTQPPPKKESGRGGRRSRGRSGSGGGRGNQGGAKGSQQGGQQRSKKNGESKSGGGRNGGGGGQSGGRSRSGSDKAADRDENKAGAGKSSDRGAASAAKTSRPKQKESPVNDTDQKETVPLDEQRAIVTNFLEGLVTSFGVDAEVSTAMEEDVIIGSVDGSSDLGLLIGPRGGTLRAIQELSRSAVQRRTDGRDTNRLMVDVAGYRERRRGALAEFASRQADVVKEEGNAVALEPMGSADRKAIHDAVVDIDGVRSVSEGDDMDRHVVLLPADD